MPLFALNHGPSTSQGWRERIAALEKESAEAQEQLEAAKQARADADAQSDFTGKTNGAISKLEQEEAKAQRRVQALAAATQMAQAQLAKAQEMERIAEERALRRPTSPIFCYHAR